MAPTPLHDSPTHEAPVAPIVLTVDQVAELLGCHRGHLYEQLREGRAPFPSRKLGSRWLIPARPFYAWLDGETAADGAA